MQQKLFQVWTKERQKLFRVLQISKVAGYSKGCGEPGIYLVGTCSPNSLEYSEVLGLLKPRSLETSLSNIVRLCLKNKWTKQLQNQ